MLLDLGDVGGLCCVEHYRLSSVELPRDVTQIHCSLHCQALPQCGTCLFSRNDRWCYRNTAGLGSVALTRDSQLHPQFRSVPSDQIVCPSL